MLTGLNRAAERLSSIVPLDGAMFVIDCKRWCSWVETSGITWPP